MLAAAPTRTTQEAPVMTPPLRLLLALALTLAEATCLHAHAATAIPFPSQPQQPASPPAANSPAPPPSPTPAPTPAASSLTLDLVLDRLQQNVLEYYSSIPSFFCSEHVLSESEHPGFLNGSVHQVSDSQFRLRRKVMPTQQVTLEESRVVETVNGKPLPARHEETPDLSGPSLLIGGFSESLKLASALGRACYAYRLEPVRPGHESDPLLLVFTNLPKKLRGPACPPYADISGRAIIDPTLMRVLHIQQTTRNHEIVPSLFGTWTWSVDYSRVLMGGKPFWLPTRTESYSFADRNSARWRYTAAYSNCHKLEVTSTMLPGSTPVTAPASSPNPAPTPPPTDPTSLPAPAPPHP